MSQKLNLKNKKVYITSKKLLNRAEEHIPLGVSANFRYWGKEKTLFVKSMKGCDLYDQDDNRYIDFRLAYGPIILGYRDTRVDSEVIKCITERGSLCGLSTDLEAQVASKIKKACKNIQKLRFTNSGNEAVMGAIRAARSFTKKQKIIVVEGGFHGLYDEMMWKYDATNSDNINGVVAIKPLGSGVANSSRTSIELVPLNNINALTNTFEKNKGEIAALIIEPILGNHGSITVSQSFMQEVRNLCNLNNALLIVDEVKTGFRASLGGAQELYNVYGDLATYAKAIGNGYPIALFGGRAEVMDVINGEEDGMVHGGTYTANLVGLSAANATLDVLLNTDAINTVLENGNRIKQILTCVLNKHGVSHSFTGPNSMFGLHFLETAPTNVEQWHESNTTLYTAFAHCLIDRGIIIEPDSREPWFICEAHRNVDENSLEEKIDGAIREAMKLTTI